VPANSTVVPRIEASAPSPDRVAVQELGVQETLSELNVQADSGARTNPPASNVVASRTVVDVEDMLRG
jgi:hypothetical protein